MESTIISPVTGNSDVEIVEEYNSNRIQELYFEQFGIDVSRFFSKNKVFLIRCRTTGFKFFYPKELEGDGEFYSELSKVKKSYYHQRWEHGYALSKVQEGAKWLEVGVGDGFFLRQMKKRTPYVSGLELNRSQVNQLRNEGLDVYPEIVEEHLTNDSQVYDGIALFQVLEHIYEVSSFFRNANRLLKEGGKLILSVPNNNPYLYKFDKWHVLNLPPHHIGYWDKSSLIKSGRLFGFRMIDFKYDLLQKSEIEYLIRLPKNNRMLSGFYSLVGSLIFALPKRFSDRALDFMRHRVFTGRNICMEFEKIDGISL